MPKLTVEKLYCIGGVACDQVASDSGVACYSPSNDASVLHVVANGDVLFTLEIATLNPTQIEVNQIYTKGGGEA